MCIIIIIICVCYLLTVNGLFFFFLDNYYSNSRLQKFQYFSSLCNFRHQTGVETVPKIKPHPLSALTTTSETQHRKVSGRGCCLTVQVKLWVCACMFINVADAQRQSHKSHGNSSTIRPTSLLPCPGNGSWSGAKALWQKTLNKDPELAARENYVRQGTVRNRFGTTDWTVFCIFCIKSNDTGIIQISFFFLFSFRHDSQHFIPCLECT